jgi:hypothetical protein
MLTFRNPMDEDSVRCRLDDEFYRLAVLAAGHQSAFTVDRLAWKLRERLPALVAELAGEVEAENRREGGYDGD